MAKAVAAIPRRPKTAVCSPRGNAPQTNDRITRQTQSESSTEKSHETECHQSGFTEDLCNHSNSNGDDDDSPTVHSSLPSFRSCEVSKKPKTTVNSWFHNEDATFAISGKKIDIFGKRLEVSGEALHGDGRPNVELKQTLKKTTDETVNLPAHQNYLNRKIASAVAGRNKNNNNLSSIGMVIGTGCLKKWKKMENLAGISTEESLGKLKESLEASSRRKLIILKKNTEKAGSLSGMSRALQLDSKKSLQIGVPSWADDNQQISRSRKVELSKDEITKSYKNFNSDFDTESQQDFSGKNPSKGSIIKMETWDRMAQTERAISVKKWAKEQKLLCAREKLDSKSKSEVQKENVQMFSQQPTNVVSSALSLVAPPLLLVPYPSVDKIEDDKDLEVEMSKGTLSKTYVNGRHEILNEEGVEETSPCLVAKSSSTNR